MSLFNNIDEGKYLINSAVNTELGGQGERTGKGSVAQGLPNIQSGG